MARRLRAIYCPVEPLGILGRGETIVASLEVPGQMTKWYISRPRARRRGDPKRRHDGRLRKRARRRSWPGWRRTPSASIASGRAA